MTSKQLYRTASLAACILISVANADQSSENWRGFRGTRRTGKSPDTGLLRFASANTLRRPGV